MNHPTLAEQIAELKQKTKPFPLAAYLHIYQAAQHDCYTNYMEGMRLLVEFLGHPPIEIREEVKVMPFLLRSYEFVELAKTLYPENRFLGEDLIYKELTACQK